MDVKPLSVFAGSSQSLIKVTDSFKHCLQFKSCFFPHRLFLSRGVNITTICPDYSISVKIFQNMSFQKTKKAFRVECSLWCPSKSISRILSRMIICLGLQLLTSSSELLLTGIQDEINLNFCFALAPSKDLAVSVLYRYRNIPR